MWRRIAGVESQRRSRIPGQRAFNASIASPTHAAGTSTRRAASGNNFTSAAGSVTATRLSVDNQRLHRTYRRQMLGDAVPAVALIGAGVQRAGAGAEIDPGGLQPIGRHRLTQHAEEGVLLRQTVAQRPPAFSAVTRP